VGAPAQRLVRARATLQETGALVAIDDAAAIRARAPSVHRALYFLFNEGYHGSHEAEVVREDLCAEALRLCTWLAAHPVTGVPEVHALVALMCLLGARLGARRDARGDLVPLEEQDRSTWDAGLLARGFAALSASAAGETLSAYHLEAAIAAEHARAPSFAATDWPGIVALYDELLRLRPTSVVRLNRAVALAQARGPEAGLAELDAIERAGPLDDYLFFAAARADLLRRAGRPGEARPHYRRARDLARNPAEARLFARRLRECGEPD
jgi:RNA polymerase sigma-70 factor (ECF subfamily)